MAVLNLIGGCESRVSNSIDHILEKIKGNREILNGDLRIIGEKFEFIFYKSNHPGTEIEMLKSFDLPEDYVSFLCQYSRAALFRDLEFGSSRCTILSPHNIIDYWKGYSIDHPCYPIAWSSHSLGCMCVDQDRIHSGNGYLTWIESMDPDNPIDIDLTFTEWLDKLIEHEGKEFWITPYEE